MGVTYDPRAKLNKRLEGTLFRSPEQLQIARDADAALDKIIDDLRVRKEAEDLFEEEQ